MKLRAERAKRHLSWFIRDGWHVLEPSTPLEWSWHHEAICQHLQAMIEDWAKHQTDASYTQRLQNLLINVPPGTMKSRIVNVYFPAWVWLRWPSWKGIFLSANPRVAVRDSLLCRDLLASDWYRRTFTPTWAFKPDQDAKTLFKNTAGGYRQAMGFSSRITGDRADALVWDDPHDAKEALSDTMREGVLERWDNAIANRVNDLRSSLRIGIMQRLHAHDLAGHVLGQGGWEHLRIPMAFETTPTCPCQTCQSGATVLGWSDPRTTDGELLQPDRFPPDVLDAERVRLGSYGWAGQMQQNPIPRGGGMVKLSWFKRYNTPPEHPEQIVQSWDTAGSAKDLSAYWVCTTWAVTPTGVYLLHVLRQQMDYPTGKRLSVSHADHWKPAALLIENKSTGLSLIQELQAETSLPVIPVEPEGDKITRMSVETPAIEAGNVYLPERAEWLADYEIEVGHFPNSGTKDQADSTSQFLRWWRTQREAGPRIRSL